MARSLDEFQGDVTKSIYEEIRDRRVGRSTARAFAAAISAFAISALVINTSSEALDPTGTVAENSLRAGTITLTDDDENRALFDLDNMAPGRPTSECIQIVYAGTILPVDLSMVASASGSLAPHLGVTVEEGSGAAFRDCSGFEPGATLFQGTLDVLAAGDAAQLGQFLNEGDSRSYRFTFEMADEQEAVGQASTVNFAWEVTPSP